MSLIDLAIVGATGAVGEAVVKLLEQREFPVQNLHLLASERTAGTSLLFNKQTVMVEELKDFDFATVKLAIFVANDKVSAEFLPKAQAAGCMVIDNSQVFADNAPLIVPSVNGELLSAQPQFVVNPDSSPLVLATVLKPLLENFNIEQVNVVALHSVSGHGKKAINELASQTASLLNGRGAEPDVFSKQIAFNVLPNVGKIDEQGHSAAENRLVKQTRRLLQREDLRISCTHLQLPVFYADCMTVHIRTHEQIHPVQVLEILEKNKEIKFLNDNQNGDFATPVTEMTSSDSIFVSRLRGDMSDPNGINLWLGADNVRKSGAFNTILIAEELIKTYL